MDGIAFKDMRIGRAASIGKTATKARVASMSKERATLRTPCAVAGKVVIGGKATVMPRSRA